MTSHNLGHNESDKSHTRGCGEFYRVTWVRVAQVDASATA